MATRVQMWRAGVSEITLAGDLHGYLKDSCPKKISEKGNECACVALIHGLGDDALTWKEVLLWPDSSWQGMGLNENLKLFAMDLPGSGGTPGPGDLDEYRVRRLAAKLRQTLAGLCPRWVVVGNNYGGWVAVWLALDWSSGVRRLLLLSPSGMAHQSTEGFPTAPNPEALKEFQKRAYFHPQELSNRVWAEVARRFRSSNIRQVLQAQSAEDALDLNFPTLEPPTLLLWGKGDQINPISVGYQMRSLKPSSVWREAKDCGHLLQRECPSIVVKSIVDMINYGAM